MKIERFIAKGVRGYMDFNISFKERLTFLIGINGSGKTTVLKLLSGLLSPSYMNLIQIEFTYIAVQCDNRNSKIFISCTKDDKKLSLSYNDKRIKITNDIDIPQYSDDNIERKNCQIYEETYNNFQATAFASFIKDLKNPLFLGLSRRQSRRDSEEIEDYFKYSSIKRKNPFWDDIDAVDIALNEIQDIVYYFIRNNANRQSFYADQFRRKVIKDVFTPNEFGKEHIADYTEELQGLNSRKIELKEAISRLGLEDIFPNIDFFFDKLKEILEIILNEKEATNKSSEAKYASIEWMLNCSQLERVDKIISYGREYSENLSKLNAPLDRFTNSVNLFFKESKKEIIVDRKGSIKVKNKSKEPHIINMITELSSGEKQIVIMLAYLALRKKNKGDIFVVDEPELSLHISWQEIFVDALLEASPDTQFILATHSPSILSKIERKELCVDLSK